MRALSSGIMRIPAEIRMIPLDYITSALAMAAIPSPRPVNPIWSVVVAVNATVTLCHTGTRNIADHMRRADVIVAAMGSAGFVKPENVKDGAVLMDVGVSRVFDEQTGRFRIRGDVDKACYDKVSAYSPNPGGVGPMTRAMLLANVVEMAERKM